MRTIDPLRHHAIRAALRIHDHLAGTNCVSGLIQLPTHEWDYSAKLLQRLELAIRRGWRAASDSLLTDLEFPAAAAHGVRYMPCQPAALSGSQSPRASR
jgi:hypothetical protein